MEESQVQGENADLEVEVDEAFADGFEEFGEEPSNEIKEEAIQDIIQQNPSFSEEQVRELFEQNNQRLFGKIG